MVMSQLVFAQNLLNIKSPEEFRKKQEEKLSGIQIVRQVVEGDTIEVELRSGDLGYVESETEEDKPIPYPEIEDKDILWSKVVWEVIDLNERINQPYYYTSEDGIESFVSLYEALVMGMKAGEIKEIYDDDTFMYRLTKDQFAVRTSKIDTSDYAINQLNAGLALEEGDIDYINLDTRSVRLIKIKGMWYIDKRMGELRYRLLGIAPMGPDVQSQSFTNEEDYVDLFWVWYADAREYLHKFKVFNPRNSSSRLSFDDLLNARRFHSIIYKSQGAAGTGKIEEYLPQDSKAQIAESKRIKESILQMETDMWNY